MSRLLERKMNGLMKEKALVSVREGDFSQLTLRFGSLFRDRHFYAPVPLESIRSVANYQWADEARKKVAFENFACACVAMAEGMKAQVMPRINNLLKVYDTDRVEKNLGLVQRIYPGAKVFGGAYTNNSPMVEGKDFIWVGKRVRGEEKLAKPDELIPVDVMKRVYDIRNSRVDFDDYFMFSPAKSYEKPKRKVMVSEIKRLGNDARSLARGARDAARAAFGTVSDAGQWVSNNFSARSMKVPERVTEIRDPVLTGVINGSLSNKRYFFIEIGRWVETI